MTFDAYSYISGTPTAPTVATASGHSSPFSVGLVSKRLKPSRGKVIEVAIRGVIGNPQVLYYTQSSPDGVTWVDLDFDEGGPTSFVGTRRLKFAHYNGEFRLAWLFGATDPGEGSNNSSSSSSYNYNSSSTGGAQSITFFAGLVPSSGG